MLFSHLAGSRSWIGVRGVVAEDGTQGILIFKKQEEKGDSMGEKTDEVLREPSGIPVIAKEEEYSKRLTTEERSHETKKEHLEVGKS